MTVTPSGWHRIKDILSDALEVPDLPTRTAIVTERCGNDAELLSSVLRFLDFDSSSTQSLGPVIDAPFDPGPRYLLERLLGAGGVSQVYLAKDTQLAGRLVVLKTLTGTSATNSWIRLKAHHEMEALARIRHDHVVQALDFYLATGDRAVLVLQYLEGATLRESISIGPLPPNDVLRYISQIASALDHAHSSGVLHRDLKPENVILQPDGLQQKAILIDFGIAKVESPTEAQETETIILAGTTSYMAPEQLMGAATTASDQYALAVIAFELLTATRPFYPANPVQLYQMQRNVMPALQKQVPKLSSSTLAVLGRALSFNPDRRYPDCSQFATDLNASLSQQPTSLARQSRRRLLLGLGAASATVVAVYSGRQQVEDIYDSFVAVPQVVEWDGLEEPVNLGYEVHHNLKSSWLPNADRLGYKGLRLSSNSQGEFTRFLTRAHKKQLLQRGWTLSCEMAAIKGCTFAILDLEPYRKRFDVYLVARDQEQFLILHEGYKPTFRGAEYLLPGPPGTVHRIEFVAAPGSYSAKVFANGILLAEAYPGQPDYQYGYTLSFGTAQYASETGEGIVKSLRLALS